LRGFLVSFSSWEDYGGKLGPTPEHSSPMLAAKYVKIRRSCVPEVLA
jgi:hypothetical protein